MMTSVALSIVAVALTVATSQQQATPPPPPPQTADAPPPSQGRGAGRGDAPQRPAAADLAKLQTVEDLLEGMEISNADKFLQVDNQHYGDFIQRLRNLQKMRRQHQNQRQRLVMELRRMTNQPRRRRRAARSADQAARRLRQAVVPGSADRVRADRRSAERPAARAVPALRGADGAAQARDPDARAQVRLRRRRPAGGGK